MLFQGKNKANIIIVVVVVLLLLAIYFAGKRRGKASAEGPQVQYPQGGSQIPSGWSPIPLADELHDVMDGLFTLSGTKNKAFKKVLDLPTDEMKIAVYNAFNQKYFNQGHGTLTQWLRDENYYDYIINYKQQLIDKLISLNCP